MDNDSDVASSDDEPVTAENVLKSLESAWLNEKFSPELLPNQSELVDCMLQQVQQIEDNISTLRKGDFRITIHHMELDRIRFIITSYLRNRLDKIETFTAHILEQESKRAVEQQHLSAGEYQFARNYHASIEDHFGQLALRHMPSNFQTVDREKCLIKPNLGSHIFLRANRMVTGIVVEGDIENGDEEVDLAENSQHIMQYQPISDLVKNGSIQLI